MSSKKGAKKNELAGKTIVFTGTLQMKRADATNAAQLAGATGNKFNLYHRKYLYLPML
jgi:NAD-dependent DNA ligase